MKHAFASGLLLLILFSASAQAGRRPFIWTWDTQLVPQGDLELETWLWAKGRTDAAPGRLATNWIWWGPVYGVNDHLEVAVPFQVIASRESTELESFELDTRIRFLPREEKGFVTPLLRLAYHHGIPARVASRLDANFVLRLGGEETGGGLPGEEESSWGTGDIGGTYGNLELGAQLFLPQLRGGAGDTALLMTWAGGIAMPFQDGQYTFAIETFGEVPTIGMPTADVHGFVGPSIGFTKGRVWATLGVLIGLTPLFPDTPQFMPRLIWAVVL